MDTLLTIARRLTAPAALLLLLCAPMLVRATLVADYTAAKTACGNWTAGYPTTSVDRECRDGVAVSGRNSVQGWERIWYISGGVRTGNIYQDWHKAQEWEYNGTKPPDNPCTSNPPPTVGGSLAGKYLNGYSYCAPTTDSSGATVMCRMNVSVSGPPTMNQWGSWRTPGTTTNSGTLCDGTPGDGGIKTADGGKPSPMPPNPNTNPPTSPPPKACGGGSCYDPNNDNFCAVSGGVQICIPGNTARTPGGGCASAGDSTICAGSPTAPTPPAAQVPDPPTAITNNDGYTQADPGTGANMNVNVTNYTNQGGTQSTSGQAAGDSGPGATGGDPAPGSSTAGPSGSYSGGGDCASPPVCTGDAVMCGVARQQWTAMCQAKKDAAQLHTDLTGTGAPSDLDALKSKYGQGDVWSDADTSQDSTVGGQANAGNYDTSGFGYGTACPLKDISVSLGSRGTFVIPLQDKCVVGDWLRALVLGFALFTAAIITAGGRGS